MLFKRRFAGVKNMSLVKLSLIIKHYCSDKDICVITADLWGRAIISVMNKIDF